MGWESILQLVGGLQDLNNNTTSKYKSSDYVINPAGSVSGLLDDLTSRAENNRKWQAAYDLNKRQQDLEEKKAKQEMAENQIPINNYYRKYKEYLRRYGITQ